MLLFDTTIPITNTVIMSPHRAIMFDNLIELLNAFFHCRTSLFFTMSTDHLIRIGESFCWDQVVDDITVSAPPCCHWVVLGLDLDCGSGGCHWIWICDQTDPW